MSGVVSKRILVTGGAGFLGSHLCDRLVAQGHEVLCVDNYFTGRRANVAHLLGAPGFELMRHDVTFPLYVEVDEIYNLACPASPVHYQFDPVQTTKTSVHGAINMLGLAKRMRAKMFQASTSEVYGDPRVHPQTEDYWGNVNPIGPRSCYDEGKRCAETLCFDYHRQHELRIKVVRIFNTYGPRMHPNDGRVVSNFIVQALKGEPITLYGDGSQTRSFCYVDDLIEGFLRLMASPDDVTGPINIGNPGEFTIRELAEKVIALTGSRSELVHRPLPENDPTQRQPDITRAKALLDWEPTIALEQGLKKTIAYFDALLAGRRTRRPEAPRPPARAGGSVRARGAGDGASRLRPATQSDIAQGRGLAGCGFRARASQAPRRGEVARPPVAAGQDVVLPRQQARAAGEEVHVLRDEALRTRGRRRVAAGDRVRREALVHQRLVDEGDRAAVRRGGSRSPSPRSGSSSRRSRRARGRRSRRTTRVWVQIMLRASSGSRMSPSTGGDRRVGHVAQPQCARPGGRRARRRSGGRSSADASRRRPGRGGEAGHLLLELLGQPLVVAVLEGDPGAARLGDAEVARAGGAAGCAGAAITRRRGSAIAARRLEGAVGRAVVDDDELEVAPRSGAARSRSPRRSSRPGCRPGSRRRRAGCGAWRGAHAGSSVGRPL